MLLAMIKLITEFVLDPFKRLDMMLTATFSIRKEILQINTDLKVGLRILILRVNHVRFNF